MGRTIDERIVQMTFDGKNFEKNANNAMNVLTKLNGSLKLFKSSQEAFSPLERAASSIDLSGISNAVDTARNSFGVFEVAAITAIANVTNRAVNSGVKLVKSLSVDQIANGWNKYAAAVASQQTIMSAVAGKINKETGEAYNIDDVVARIDKLKWYTDETSYNISQMTDAIGSFTSAGVDLDDATKAIIGISNACADAGVSTEKAQSAFIGLSKAIGQGYLSNGVWVQQIKTSGLTNSERFKQSIIDAGVAMGTLSKETKANGDIIYKTTSKTKKAGELVSAADFTSALSQQWANTEVLNLALSSYSDTVDSIYGLVTDGKIDTSSKVIADLTEEIAKQGKTLSDFGLNETYDTASEAIETLVAAYKELGMEVPQSLSAFLRAQEAISLDQAIQSIKDAVSSKWSTTFELLFGNYEEAKKLWTKLSEEGWSWFASGGDERNALLKSWHESTSLISDLDKRIIEVKENIDESLGASKTYDALNNQKQAVEELYDALRGGDDTKIVATWQKYRGLWSKVLPDQAKYLHNLELIAREEGGLNNYARENDLLTDDYRKELTNYLKDAVEYRTGYEIFIDAITKALENITTLVETVKSAWRNVFPQSTVEQLTNLTKGFENLIDNLTPTENFLESLTNTFSGLFSIIKVVTDIFGKFFEGIVKPVASSLQRLAGAIFNVTGGFGKMAQSFEESVANSSTLSDIFTTIGDTLSYVIDKIADYVNKFGDLINKNKDGEDSFSVLGWALEGVKKVLEGIEDVVKGVVPFFEKLGSVIAKVGEFLANALGHLKDGFLEFGEAGGFNNLLKVGVVGFFLTLDKKLKNFSIVKIIDSFFGNITKGISDGFGSVQNLVESATKFIEKLTGANIADTSAIEGVAKSLLMLAGALLIISLIPSEKLLSSLGSMAALMLGLAGIIKLISKVSGTKFTDKFKSIFDAASLMLIGTALLELAVALKMLSGLNMDQIGTGLIGIGGLLLEVIGFLKLMDGLNASGKGLASLIGLGLGLLILSGTLKILATMTDDDIATSLTALGGLLLEIWGFMALMNSKGGGANAIAASAALLILAPALLVLSGTLKILGSMDMDSIANALIALGGALAELWAFFSLMKGGTVSVLGTALAMLIIAPALLAVAATLSALSKFDHDAIANSLLTLGGALAELWLFFSLMKGGTIQAIGAALAMLILAPALVTIANVLKTLGTMDMDSVGHALVALGGGLGELMIFLAGSGINFIGALASALALRLLAPALIDLATTLQMLGNMSLSEVGHALAALGGSLAEFLIFLASGAIEDPIKVIAMALALRVLAPALVDLAGAITTLSTIGDMEQVGVAVTALLAGLASVAAFMVGETFMNIGGNAIIVSAAVYLLANGLLALAQAIQVFASLDSGSIEQGLANIKEGLSSVGEVAMESLSTGVESKEDDVINYMQDFSGDMTDVLDISGETPQLGMDALTGLLEGFGNPELLNQIYQSGANTGNTYKRGFKDALDQNSPSKEMMRQAGYAIQGLLIGFRNNMGDVEESGIETGNTVLDSFRQAISSSTEALDADVNPVISPILDLSNIQNGAGMINSMLNTDAIGVGLTPAFSGASSQGVTLNASFTVNSNQAITRSDVRQWSSWLSDALDEELGRKL